MATRDEIRGTVADYIRRHPEQSYRKIAAKLHCSYSTIFLVAREYQIVRREKPRVALTVDALKALVD
jgi:hypothetical protein